MFFTTEEVPVQSRRVMRVRCLAALIAAVLFACVPAHAQVIVYEVFGAYLDSLRDQAGIPGLAAAIVDFKGIVWERAYGRQNIAGFNSDAHRHAL